jgi:hypothetical protein
MASDIKAIGSERVLREVQIFLYIENNNLFFMNLPTKYPPVPCLGPGFETMLIAIICYSRHYEHCILHKNVITNIYKALVMIILVVFFYSQISMRK